MEIYQARKISNIPTAISQPFDFVCSHNEKFKIKDIGVTEVKTKSDLLRVTSQDKPDIHTQDYVLQLQYHINGTRGHFLLVDGSGEVKANGQCRDQRTLLTVIHNFTQRRESCYQIIGWGDKFNQKILYMDGTELKLGHTSNLRETTTTTHFFHSEPKETVRMDILPLCRGRETP